MSAFMVRDVKNSVMNINYCLINVFWKRMRNVAHDINIMKCITQGGEESRNIGSIITT